MQIILIVIVSILALILILAALMKKDYQITSEVLINKPRQTVFNYVKNIGNQKEYSKWVMADPNIKITTQGIDGTKGFKSAWTSEVKNVGVGEQEIMEIREGEGYHAEVRFEKPFKGISQAHVSTQAISQEQTKVTTVFETTTPFPMNILVPMIKKMLKKDMDENSMNLKRVIERSV